METLARRATMILLFAASLRSSTAFVGKNAHSSRPLLAGISKSCNSQVSSSRIARFMSETASAAAAAPVKAAESSASKPLKIRRILSGVQPTGSLHLGNYLGAIRQWVDFQNNVYEKDSMEETAADSEELAPIKTENFFCVVDLHAITMPQDPSELAESTLASAALYLAAGIDPKKSRVFVQSHVPAHTELAWLLSCMTPLNWLERMIQFKEKARKGGESVGTGLLTYPVLMASDILLYQASQVPVGEDQRQHLELARDIARRFHDLYNKGNAFKKRCKAAGISSRPTFVEPNAMIVETGARVMSLTDGNSKMSKSDPNDKSRINLLDPPDLIRSKVKRCKTDALQGLEWDNPERPEATNLLNIYQAVQPVPTTREQVLERVGHMSWGEFKPALADAIVDHLSPIQEKYHAIRKDEAYLRQVLAEGAGSANEIASQTLAAARIAMGFVPPIDSGSSS
ncbi:hypothetical protein MPSEU_000155300 [Mayamaea pseudoterrestris]|nr:hypothetical protein MPSEU_000155300 [Mayamaea pseudoterrestris]